MIIASFLCNLVFAGLTVRHFVLMPVKEANPPLTFFINGDILYKGLSIDSNDVLFIGDTQFAAYPVTELTGMIKVKNRGIYYDSARGVLKRIKYMAGSYPKKIFMLCGINELENEVPVTKTASYVDTAVRLIKSKSPETKIYILSVLPTSLKFGEKPHSIESDRLKLNKLYASIANSNRATYINLDHTFESNGLKEAYDVGDKIHLNAAGYKRMTEILYPYIN